MPYTYKVTEYKKRVCLNVITDTWDDSGIKHSYYAYIPISDIQQAIDTYNSSKEAKREEGKSE
jgi:hypothetical protein